MDFKQRPLSRKRSGDVWTMAFWLCPGRRWLLRCHYLLAAATPSVDGRSLIYSLHHGCGARRQLCHQGPDAPRREGACDDSRLQLLLSSIRNQGCGIAESALKREGDSYVVDWDHFERQCQDEKVTVSCFATLIILPDGCGRERSCAAWGHLCGNHVRVISDEIHCELVMPGHTFVPFAAVCEQTSATVLRCARPPSRLTSLACKRLCYLLR